MVASAPVGRHTGIDYRGLQRIAVVGKTLSVTDGGGDTLGRIAVAPGG